MFHRVSVCVSEVMCNVYLQVSSSNLSSNVHVNRLFFFVIFHDSEISTMSSTFYVKNILVHRVTSSIEFLLNPFEKFDNDEYVAQCS